MVLGRGETRHHDQVRYLATGPGEQVGDDVGHAVVDRDDLGGFRQVEPEGQFSIRLRDGYDGVRQRRHGSFHEAERPGSQGAAAAGEPPAVCREQDRYAEGDTAQAAQDPRLGRVQGYEVGAKILQCTSDLVNRPNVPNGTYRPHQVR